MPGAIPVWSVALPIDDGEGVSFTDEEEGDLAMMKMWRWAAEKRGEAAGS
jgi:hypothetical protein